MNCLLRQSAAQRASSSHSSAHARPARAQLVVKAVGDPAASSRPGGRSGRDPLFSAPSSNFDAAPSVNVQRPGGRGGRGALPSGGIFPTSTASPLDVSRPGGGAFRGGFGGNGGEGGGSGRPGPDGFANSGPIFFLLFAGIVGTAVVYTSKQASKQA